MFKRDETTQAALDLGSTKKKYYIYINKWLILSQIQVPKQLLLLDKQYAL